MSDLTRSIELDVDVTTAYNQWTQFEVFPAFMEGVESVAQIDDRRLHWVVEIGGIRREFDAEITHQEPDRRIAWMSTSGPRQGGDVTFEPLDPHRCRVTLRMVFEPEGMAEQAGDKLGIVPSRAEGDLERFKEFIERRGVETGGWRGRI